MTNRSDDRATRQAREAEQLLAEMRAGVEAAAGQLDEVTSELSSRRAQVDDLETVADLVLGLSDTVIVVVNERRQITGLSRGAKAQHPGLDIGKPLSSLVPAELADAVSACLDEAPDHPSDLDGTQVGARLHPLPGGGAVLVVADR